MSLGQKTWVLGAKNIVLMGFRAPKPCFNVIMARAFSSLERAVSKTRHLLCNQGRLLLMKGIYPDDELNAIQDPYQVFELEVPGLQASVRIARAEIDFVPEETNAELGRQGFPPRAVWGITFWIPAADGEEGFERRTAVEVDADTGVVIAVRRAS